MAKMDKHLYVKLDDPKIIDHDKFIDELGFPCSLMLNKNGETFAIFIQNEYYNAEKVLVAEPNTDKKTILDKVANHVT